MNHVKPILVTGQDSKHCMSLWNYQNVLLQSTSPKKQLEHIKPTTVSAKTYETELSAAGHETFLTDALARVRTMPQQKRRKKNKNYTLLTSCLEIFKGTEGGKLSVPCPGGKQINTYSFYVPPPPGTSSFVYWLLGYTFLEDKWYCSKAIQANHHLNNKVRRQDWVGVVATFKFIKNCNQNALAHFHIYLLTH